MRSLLEIWCENVMVGYSCCPPNVECMGKPYGFRGKSRNQQSVRVSQWLPAILGANSWFCRAFLGRSQILYALTNVLEKHRKLQPAGAYGEAYSMFKAHAQSSMQSLQQANLNDQHIWIIILESSSIQKPWYARLYPNASMPGLFGCLHNAIADSLNTHWALIHIAWHWRRSLHLRSEGYTCTTSRGLSQGS